MVANRLLKALTVCNKSPCALQQTRIHKTFKNIKFIAHAQYAVHMHIYPFFYRTCSIGTPVCFARDAMARCLGPRYFSSSTGPPAISNRPSTKSASDALTNAGRYTTLNPIYNTTNNITLIYAVKKLDVLQGMNAVKPCVMMMSTLKNRPYHAR